MAQTLASPVHVWNYGHHAWLPESLVSQLLEKGKLQQSAAPHCHIYEAIRLSQNIIVYSPSWLTNSNWLLKLPASWRTACKSISADSGSLQLVDLLQPGVTKTDEHHLFNIWKYHWWPSAARKLYQLTLPITLNETLASAALIDARPVKIISAWFSGPSAGLVSGFNYAIIDMATVTCCFHV